MLVEIIIIIFSYTKMSKSRISRISRFLRKITILQFHKIEIFFSATYSLKAIKEYFICLN